MANQYTRRVSEQTGSVSFSAEELKTNQEDCLELTASTRIFGAQAEHGLTDAFTK